MANYCSKCLGKTQDGEELCVYCRNIIASKNIADIKVEGRKAENIVKRNTKLRKCFYCGNDMDYFDIISSKFRNDKQKICIDCYTKEQAKIEELKTEERHYKMKEGKAFINICRSLQLSNGSSNMEVIIGNNKYQDKKTFVLAIGGSEMLELTDRGRFYLYASVLAWPRSKELSIDVDYGETVFIEITTKSARGHLGATARLLLNEEMVLCKIIKREIIDGDNIKVLELNR